MSMPFYVLPEQLMKDKADYARKGIARGRSVVVLVYDKGIAFVAENPHESAEDLRDLRPDRLRRGRHVLRVREPPGRRHPVRGPARLLVRPVRRERARARQRLRADPRHGLHPGAEAHEIELVVAEVGETPERDQIYRLTYDGSVADQHGFVVMGGASAQAETSLRERWAHGLTLGGALRLAVDTLAQDPNGGPARTLTAEQLEVAVLDRQRPRRTFRRIAGPLLEDLLNSESPVSDAPMVDDGRPGHHDVLTGGLPVPETPGYRPAAARGLRPRHRDQNGGPVTADLYDAPSPPWAETRPTCTPTRARPC